MFEASDIVNMEVSSGVRGSIRSWIAVRPLAIWSGTSRTIMSRRRGFEAVTLVRMA